MNSISQVYQLLSMNRRISPLSREIGVSRKRLVNFLSGKISVDDLTVSEYKKLKASSVLEGVIEDINDVYSLPKMEYMASYKVRFNHGKIRAGLEVFRDYLRPSVLALKGRASIPYGHSFFHLWILMEIEDIRVHEDTIDANEHANHWPINVSEQQQKIWLEECIKTAGSEEKFRKIWERWNLDIEHVEVHYHALDFKPKKNNGQTEFALS